MREERKNEEQEDARIGRSQRDRERERDRESEAKEGGRMSKGALKGRAPEAGKGERREERVPDLVCGKMDADENDEKREREMAEMTRNFGGKQDLRIERGECWESWHWRARLAEYGGASVCVGGKGD